MNNKLQLQNAFDRLVSLETPEQVAEYLMNHGIKGIREELNYCPLAVYFQGVNETPDSEIGVDGRKIILSTYTYGGNYEEESLFECTPAMVDFIRQFDDGGFDELNEDEYEYEGEGF